MTKRRWTFLTDTVGEIMSRDLVTVRPDDKRRRRLLLQADGQVHELGPGQIAVLAENLHEPIQAAERSAFLVTVAWPEGAGAWAQEEAAGRVGPAARHRAARGPAEGAPA